MQEEITTLLTKAFELGLFEAKAPLQSREAQRLMAEARSALDATGVELRTAPAGEALRLVDTYDLLHRLVRRTAAPAQLLDQTVLRAFAALQSGDKTVDQYDLYRAIRSRVERRNPQFLGAPLTWLAAKLQTWHKSAKTAQPLPAYDKEQQRQLLSESDLTPFEGKNQAAFKSRLRVDSQSIRFRGAQPIMNIN